MMDLDEAFENLSHHSEEEEESEEEDSQSSEEEEQQEDNEQDNSVASDNDYIHDYDDVIDTSQYPYAILTSHSSPRALGDMHFNTAKFMSLARRSVEVFPTIPNERVERGTQTLEERRRDWMKPFLLRYKLYKPRRKAHNALLKELVEDTDIDKAIVKALDTVRRPNQTSTEETIEAMARWGEANGNTKFRDMLNEVDDLGEDSTSLRLPSDNNNDPEPDDEEATTAAATNDGEGSPAASLPEPPVSPPDNEEGGGNFDIETPGFGGRDGGGAAESESEGRSSSGSSNLLQRILFSPLLSTPRNEVRRQLGDDDSNDGTNENVSPEGSHQSQSSYDSQFTEQTWDVLDMLIRNMKEVKTEPKQLSFSVLSSGYISKSYLTQVVKELLLLSQEGFISLKPIDGDNIITTGPRFYEGVDSEDDDEEEEEEVVVEERRDDRNENQNSNSNQEPQSRRGGVAAGSGGHGDPNDDAESNSNDDDDVRDEKSDSRGTGGSGAGGEPDGNGGGPGGGDDGGWGSGGSKRIAPLPWKNPEDQVKVNSFIGDLLNGKEDLIESLKESETSLKGEVNSLKQSMKEKETSEIELKDEVIDLKNQLNETSKKLNDAKSENEQLKGSLLNAREEAEQQRQVWEAEVATCKAESEQQRQVNQQLEAEAVQQQTRIATLEGDKQRLQHAAEIAQARIESLENITAQQQAEAAQYQATITSLGNDNQRLEAQVEDQRNFIQFIQNAVNNRQS